MDNQLARLMQSGDRDAINAYLSQQTISGDEGGNISINGNALSSLIQPQQIQPQMRPQNRMARPEGESGLRNMIRNESTGEYLTLGGGRSMTPTEFDPEWRAKKEREQRNIAAYNQALEAEQQRQKELKELPQRMALAKYREQELKNQQAQAELAGGVKPQFSPDLGGYVYPPDANNPQGRFVPVEGVTPKPKALSPTAQKELFEAEDIAQSSQNVGNILKEALKLNDIAYSGAYAKERAVARSNLPGQSLEADATINLDNMMTGQALESLKATFGGMPTEGERKILLDMQASASKTPSQRKAIIERAIIASDSRAKLNASKAERLRSGQYFNPKQQTQPQADTTDTDKEARYQAWKAGR